MSTDGFACYRNAVYSAFGESVDYAQSIKTYAQTEEPQRRYSPAKIVTVENKPIYGNPKEERICTSHIERQNGSLCSVVQAAHAFDLRVLQEDGEPSRGAGAALRFLQFLPRALFNQADAGDGIGVGVAALDDG